MNKVMTFTERAMFCLESMLLISKTKTVDKKKEAEVWINKAEENSAMASSFNDGFLSALNKTTTPGSEEWCKLYDEIDPVGVDVGIRKINKEIKELYNSF